MQFMDIIKRFSELKIIPVAVIDDAEDALPLGKVMLDAGLPVLEITFRTAAAADSITILTRKFPEMIVGAGTVLKTDQVDAAINAGSQFIVTPGFNPTIVDYCIKKGILIIPGVNAPSFIEWGLERGLTHFKFFPADISGGVKALQVFGGPYPMAKFIPTGGVNNSNLMEYLNLKNVFACGGSWIIPKELITSKNFEEIQRKTKEVIDLIKKHLK